LEVVLLRGIQNGMKNAGHVISQRKRRNEKKTCKKKVKTVIPENVLSEKAP